MRPEFNPPTATQCIHTLYRLVSRVHEWMCLSWLWSLCMHCAWRTHTHTLSVIIPYSLIWSDVEPISNVQWICIIWWMSHSGSCRFCGTQMSTQPVCPIRRMQTTPHRFCDFLLIIGVCDLTRLATDDKICSHSVLLFLSYWDLHNSHMDIPSQQLRLILTPVHTLKRWPKISADMHSNLMWIF